MSDYAELKRLAESLIELNRTNLMDWAATVEDARIGKTHTEYALAANPAAVLALIAELELAQTIGRLAYNFDGYKAVLDERDRLRAEVAGLKTGYEACERVNAELKAECARSTEREILQLAEIEALRKALVGILDLYDTDEGCRSLPQYINGRAALGQGEKS